MNKKEYKWRSSYLCLMALINFFGGLALLSLAISLIAIVLPEELNIYLGGLFWVGVVLIFWNVVHFILKGCYIRITDEGIYISSCFFSRAKDINWEAISKIKKIHKRKQAIILSRWYEKDFPISLRPLKKDDGIELFQTIKAKIENKIDVEEK